MTLRLLLAILLPGVLVISILSSASAWAAPAAQADAKLLADRYRQALRIDPENLHLHYNLGVVLLLDDQASEAISELKLAYPAFADTIEMNFNLGLALAQTGDADSALLYLERAEELGALDRPEIFPLADSYLNLANRYRAAGNDAEAERLYRTVLGLAPERHEVHRQLGDLLARGGQTESAVHEFEAYLAVRPDDLAAREYLFAIHYNRALGLLESDPRQAGEAFARALEIQPGNPLPLYYLGYLDYTRAEIESSVTRLAEAYPKVEPEVRQSIRALLHNCALTLLRQRKTLLALEALKPLLEGESPEVKDLNLAGGIHLDLKQYSQAYDYFNKALAAEPTNREATINRLAAEAGAVEELLAGGRAKLSDSDFDAAQEYFERAGAINPADPRPAEALAAVASARENQGRELFAQARGDLAQGQPRSALDKVRAGLELLPGEESGLGLEAQALAALNAEISATLGQAAADLAQGDLPRAREAYARILELDPEQPSALQGLTEVEQRSASLATELLGRADRAVAGADFAKARSWFQEALLLQPDLAEARAGLARLEAQVDTRQADALRSGRKALEEGRLALAREHFQAARDLRDTPAVQAGLDQVEQASRERVTALLNQAERVGRDGNPKEARALYAKALQVDPGSAAARRGLESLETLLNQKIEQNLQAAQRELAAGNYPQALEQFRKVLELAPTSAAAQQGLKSGREKLAHRLAELAENATAALDRGDLVQAETALDEALALDPFHAGSKTALQRLERLRLSGAKPGDEETLYLQGIEFYTSGRYEEAISAWEQVLTLAPGHERARMNIEKAKRKLRQIQEYRNG
ncbi:hypothetical protein DESUT3_16660 [Desulfuromonas versatilis]|uniref:Tetratricopeptide repeat protein n=1 Tax=Desulfuromonas versatilis TaxID=2802975 RepID=A0ABM8HRL9_9BACT|nr:tetratricopeptide repeat protein [Desulfuromonas versatilis]BCR04597.1 hypothetical protein DESUT3_16660 [Desulfuromonas versatilis]